MPAGKPWAGKRWLAQGLPAAKWPPGMPPHGLLIDHICNPNACRKTLGGQEVACPRFACCHSRSILSQSGRNSPHCTRKGKPLPVAHSSSPAPHGGPLHTATFPIGRFEEHKLWPLSYVYSHMVVMLLACASLTFCARIQCKSLEQHDVLSEGLVLCTSACFKQLHVQKSNSDVQSWSSMFSSGALGFDDILCSLLLAVTQQFEILSTVSVDPGNCIAQSDDELFPCLHLDRLCVSQSCSKLPPSCLYGVQVLRALRVVPQQGNSLSPHGLQWLVSP